jgi:inner membrane protein
MLVFGHIAIPLGVVTLLSGALTRGQTERYMGTRQASEFLGVPVKTVQHYIHKGTLPARKLSGKGNSKRHWRIRFSDLEAFRANKLRGRPRRRLRALPQNRSSSGIGSSFASLVKRIDVRILLIGALLPDIIDKPVGVYFFRDTFSSGRIFSHTLLFLVLITLGGLFLYWSRNKIWLLVLSFGTFIHLILDEMWRSPQTLLWPLYGFSFERIDLTRWTWDMFHELLTNPTVWISELAGVVVVACFIWLLVRRGNLYAFIRYGRI